MTKGVFFRSSKQPMKKKLPPKLMFLRVQLHYIPFSCIGIEY